MCVCVCVCVCVSNCMYTLTWLTGSLKLVMRPARRDDFSSSERALEKKEGNTECERQKVFSHSGHF